MATEQHRKIRHTNEHDETELNLTPGSPLTLVVSNSNGELRVFSSDRTTAVVRTTKHGSRSGRALEESFAAIEQYGNTIAIKVENVHWSNIGDLGRSIVDLVKGERPLVGFGESSIDVELELPKVIAAQVQNKAKVQTASGDIAIDDLSGDLDVNSASGDIHIRRGSLRLTANTASGEVEATDVEGRITARSASGDIRIQRGTLSRVSVNTASGDVHVEGAMSGNEESSFNTASGDVTLRLTAPAVKLSFGTVSGDADVQPPFEKDGRRQWRLGPAGASGPTLNVKTVSGDLRVAGSVGSAIERAMEAADRGLEAARRGLDKIQLPADVTSPSPPTPPEPPVPPTPPSEYKAEVRLNLGKGNDKPADDEVVEASNPAVEEDQLDVLQAQERGDIDEEERLNVLQALERGEIDIDEAMSRLDAIEGPPAG